MDNEFVPQGRVRSRTQKMKNFHRYAVVIFCFVIDMQVQELNHSFGETNTDLVLCMTFSILKIHILI